MSAPTPPGLGYRGCYVRGGDGTQWQAYRGVVTRSRGNTREVRLDVNRELETLILQSAPRNMIPNMSDLLRS
jgi:hypothetical protein